MISSQDLFGQLDETPTPDVHVSTGLRELDEVTRGPSPAQVWVLTGVPAQGKTTLLTQLADTLSVEHSWPTWLICPDESPRMVAARLASGRTREVLGRLTRGTATGPDAMIRQGRRRPLEQAPLHVVGQGQRDPLSVLGAIEADPPRALLVDDAHRVPGAFPARLRSLADAGAFVAVTLPRRLVVTSDQMRPYLVNQWADLADVVLEIRQATWPAYGSPRPGEADFSVLKNHWDRAGTSLSRLKRITAGS